VVHAFRGRARDGANPEAGLIDVNGTLYGTTEYGGSGYGTVYSISTTGAEKVLHSFAGGSDGAKPTQGDLLYMNGTLYGVTYAGGSNDQGTVYSITSSGGETVLHSFGSGDDGALPQWGLINVNGTMYGTTLGGGANSCGSVIHRGCGTVYSISASGVENVLHSFAGGSDGLNPTGPLINVEGKLYGTTAGYFVCCAESPFRDRRARAAAAKGRNGTVFSVTTTGTEKVLYSFTGGADGAQPDAPLIDVNGLLYSTTYRGGTFGAGTVFALHP
jgi:uncharacterized repeat protein (TIGR03803 family)